MPFHSRNIITDNYILNSLPRGEAEAIAPELEHVEMRHGEVIFDADEKIKYLYFPSTAMISVVATSYSGQSAECGVVGWEGVGGVEALLGSSTSLNHHVIQLGGDGHRADIGSMQRQFAKGGEFQKLVLACVREKMVEMSQTALCNRVHIAEQRLAKWLSMCHDRSPTDEMRITQEFAALMLGSNRVSVAQAAKVLQEHELIHYSRGRVTVVDRKGLEEFACECYGRIRAEFDRLTATGRRKPSRPSRSR